MNVKMFGEICDAFGPSGFEEDVIRTVAKYCKGLELENDAMNNLYARMPGEDPEKPVVMLDAHTDECGFMVQSIRENGSLEILMLGGVILTNLPAHTIMIRTRSGKLVRGIISSKPIHFMNEAERASQSLSIETLSVDVGAVSRKEVTEVFGISIGDPAVPEVSFSYDEERDLCFGKAFDNRAGCACIIDTMTRLCGEKDQLAVRVTGAFAAQEEVGTRGATVTSQIVRPDLAIVFEGSPSDDFYFSAAQTQGHMRGGVQIRRMDKSYISNPVFIEYAEELAKKFGIPFQETVRRGGSTNAGKISLTAKAGPVLVLGVPSRYVHTHYNFCAKSDLEAAADLAVEVIRGLDAEKIRHICRQDILK